MIAKNQPGNGDSWADFDDARLFNIYTQALVATHPEAKNDILSLWAEILERLDSRRWLIERLASKIATIRLLSFILGGVVLGLILVLLVTGPLFR
jgi:hypothetical protein